MSSNTESRGQWLWRKLSAIYGSRFLDMWGAVDPASMQAEWTNALRGVPREALQLAIAKLYHTKHPPTLPEFLELCAAATRAPVPAALTDETGRTPPEQARAQLAGIANAVDTAMHHKPGDQIEWARRLIARYECGESITSRQLQYAREAIAIWDSMHGTARALAELKLPPRIPSPHIEGEPSREPGCDDEEVRT